jgi:ATP-dependent DNA helicase RecQ
MNKPIDILKQYWQFDSFRPLQEKVIQSVLDGHDTLAILPTGAGKSICFQVPALAKNGLCLVVSPLIALMKEQIDGLRRKNITALGIYSGMEKREMIGVLKVASRSNCKFLYVSPERLETNLFKEYLASLEVSLLAVDEAHCISEWGYDFRPSYRRIAALRDELPAATPVLALSASATLEVQKDICQQLNFRHQAIFRQSVERKNLSYSVFPVESKRSKILDILKSVPGTSIIYCSRRKRTQELSDFLNSEGIASGNFHAGLSLEERNFKQRAWMADEIRVMVCTTAFGMGIDKPNVRTVIHADAPDGLEAYYQQAGRAGRDGNKAYAVLLSTRHDLDGLEKTIENRFPAPSDIKLVYQSLMNYLQLPLGNGQGNYYDFETSDFLKKFKLDVHLVSAALSTLEQEEILAFSEQVFLPSKVQFSLGKEQLYSFLKQRPDLEPLVEVLLRNYSGIFEESVFVQERILATSLRIDETQVERDLRNLESFGVIDYTPRKEKPQLYFFQPRVKGDDLNINLLRYEMRKTNYRSRIESLLCYINSKNDCRSRMMAQYFSDEWSANCGICDNCLKEKKVNMDANGASGFGSTHP